jgi:asparagine synthase (glutamine-hydrolysing)
LPTYLVSREIRRDVTVCLSGDGGDELFAGYDIYDSVLRESRTQALPAGLRGVLGSFHKLLRVGLPGRNFLRRLPLSSEERYLLLSRAPEIEPMGLLHAELQGEIDALPVDGFRRDTLGKLAQECRDGGLSILQRMTRTDMLSYLPDDVLAKVDRSSMMSSLEVRCPLLDYRIAEFAFRLPDDLRYRSGVRKYLLKVLGRKLLPSDFPFERKHGFSIPESDWIRGRWRPMFEDVFASSKILNFKRANSLMREHGRAGRHGRLLFRLFALGVFERNSGIAFG